MRKKVNSKSKNLLELERKAERERNGESTVMKVKDHVASGLKTSLDVGIESSTE